MATIRFRRGPVEEMQKTLISDGIMYVTTDENSLYVDYKNSRIRIGDFVQVNYLSDLPTIGNAYETKLYYVREKNILARWNAETQRWIQINRAGVIAVTEDPDNPEGANVVTEVSIGQDAEGRKALVIKKDTMATSEELKHITDTLDMLTGDGEGSIQQQINTAMAALLGNPTTYTTIEALETALLDTQSRVGTNEQDIENLKTRTAALETTTENLATRVSTLEGDATTEGSVAYQIAQALDPFEHDLSELQTQVALHDMILTWEDKTT